MTGTTPPPLGSRPLSQVRTEVVVGRPAVADDIVTRLRHMAWTAPEGEPWADAVRDAADEIERLRNDLLMKNRRIEELAAEIERLRRELAMLQLVRQSEELGLYE